MTARKTPFHVARELQSTTSTNSVGPWSNVVRNGSSWHLRSMVVSPSLRLLSSLSPRDIVGEKSIDLALLVLVLKVVEWLENGVLAEEDPSLNEVWEGLGELVVHVGASWDGEDVVQLLESALLGLWNPEEDHDEGDEVEAGVEAEGTD